MDLYNTKLILSFFKQTPTLRMVTQISARTPKEADRDKEALTVDALAILETTHLLIIHLEEN